MTPMFAASCHDRGTLEVISPLHVGSGEHEDDDAIACRTGPGAARHEKTAIPESGAWCGD